MLRVENIEKQIATQNINQLIFNEFKLIDTHITIDAFLRN